MKRNISILIFLIATSCVTDTKLDYDEIAEAFSNNVNKIEKIEYNIRRIDTFNSGDVWDNKGYALIETDKDDPLFGFSFYGKRDDVSKEYIYDQGYGFSISKEKKNYTIDKENYGFIGSPGGQMVERQLFYLDTIYKSVEVNEKDDYYILKYTFEDDTTYNVKQIEKTIMLDKKTFLPLSVKRTSYTLGNRSVSQSQLSNIQLNNEVSKSIKTLKNSISELTLLVTEKRIKNKLIGKKLPSIDLPNILDSHTTLNLASQQLTLLDFWEVWCGPCIASFPKVERLKTTYGDNLKVIGIVSEDQENAIKLIKEKGTTFLNVVGNKNLKQEFSINSFPRYFLINKDGIIVKEYFGFSDDIEKDIIAEINTI